MNVREVEEKDFEKVVELRKKLVNAYPEAFFETLEETEAKTEDDWKKWFERGIKGENFILVAEEGGEMVGMVGIQRLSQAKVSHNVLMVGLGVLPENAGKGIGRKLIKGLIEKTKKMDGVEKIELEVYSESTNAINLYKNLGFTEEAQLKKRAKKSDGGYQDGVFMSLYV